MWNGTRSLVLDWFISFSSEILINFKKKQVSAKKTWTNVEYIYWTMSDNIFVPMVEHILGHRSYYTYNFWLSILQYWSDLYIESQLEEGWKKSTHFLFKLFYFLSIFDSFDLFKFSIKIVWIETEIPKIFCLIFLFFGPSPWNVLERAKSIFFSVYAK